MRPPAKKRRPAVDPAAAAAVQWLESYPKVSRWAARYDILRLIEQGGGVALVPDFLPGFVAEGALAVLEGLPAERWNDTAAEEDYTHNNIAHRFWSVKAGGAAPGGGGGGALDALLRAFSQLLPDRLNAFSAARYERGHHIAPHDDRAYTPVRLDTGEVVSCSRDITCIYYLTKGWQRGMGGALVDLEAPAPAAPQPPAAAATAAGAAGEAGEDAAGGGDAAGGTPKGREYVPLFNSAIFFRVPRYHCVTPLTTDRPRYSVFGWYLQPGKLYELYSGTEQDRRGAAAAAAAAGHDRPGLPGGGVQEEAGGDQRWRAGGTAHVGRRQKRRGTGDGGGEPSCKLARRLLAKAAARQRRGQQAGTE